MEREKEREGETERNLIIECWCNGQNIAISLRDGVHGV